jgi:hypothetical protein
MLEGCIIGRQMRDSKSGAVQSLERPASVRVGEDLLPNLAKSFRSERLRVLAALVCIPFMPDAFWMLLDLIRRCTEF